MKYRKKPVVIDAEEYRPGLEDGWVWQSGCGGFALFDTEAQAKAAAGALANCCSPYVKTEEGFHVISPGDFIITGVQGERYPCKPDIFAATYETAE